MHLAGLRWPVCALACTTRLTLLAGGRGDGGGMLRRAFCCMARKAVLASLPPAAQALPALAPPLLPPAAAFAGVWELPAPAARLAAAMTFAITSATAAGEIVGTGKSLSSCRSPAAAQAATHGSPTIRVLHLAPLCTARASFVEGFAAAACSAVVTRCVHRRLSSGV